MALWHVVGNEYTNWAGIYSCGHFSPSPRFPEPSKLWNSVHARPERDGGGGTTLRELTVQLREEETTEYFEGLLSHLVSGQ